MAGEKGYCLKCKAHRTIEGGKSTVMKNGRNALKGTCKKCNTPMFKITGGSTSKCSGGKKSRRRKTSKRKSRKNRTRSRR